MLLLNLEEIADALKQKKIGVIDTDTVVGIVALYDNEEGIKRICKIKERDPTKLMPIIVANQKQRNQLVKSEPRIDEFLKGQKRPTTIIYQQKNNVLPNSSIWNQKTMGVRIVKKRWLKKLLETTGPLVATSCNNCKFVKRTATLKQIDESIVLIGQLDFWQKIEEYPTQKKPSQIFDWVNQKWVRK